MVTCHALFVLVTSQARISNDVQVAGTRLEEYLSPILIGEVWVAIEGYILDNTNTGYSASKVDRTVWNHA